MQRKKPLYGRGTPHPAAAQRQRPVVYTPLVIAGTTLVAVVLLVLLFRLPEAGFVTALYAGERAAQGPQAHPVVPLSVWEREFTCRLWTEDVVKQLRGPPYEFESEGALIKSIPLDGLDYRALVFDTSGEVQGAVVRNPQTNTFDWSHIVLEYTRTMAFALTRVRGLHCASKGRALVLGLGAGTMAGFIHAKLPKFSVDVIELSEDVLRAGRAAMGTPADSQRFKVHLGDAADAFELLGDDSRWDIILHDAYMPGPQVPPQCATQQYWQKLSDHLTEDGVMVFNFCLPFYTPAEQLEMVSKIHKSFKHVWLVEATQMSKIIVAYNYDDPLVGAFQYQGAALMRTRLGELAASPCKWPVSLQGMGYQLYVPHDEPSQFLRRLHSEASQMYCDQKRIDQRYCDWILPMNALQLEYPAADFEAIGQAFSAAGFNLTKARQRMAKWKPSPKERKVAVMPDKYRQ